MVDSPYSVSTPDDLALGRNMSMVQQGYQFGKCVVSQMGATFAYDCEYLGPTPRLAFTPLTERAYLSLTTALNAFQAGTLSGPASTGKSETIADLAKVRFLYVLIIIRESFDFKQVSVFVIQHKHKS